MQRLEENELDWLYVKLCDHVINNDQLSQSDINFYYKNLPTSLLFSGVCNRVLFDPEFIDDSLNTNKCWTKSREGLLAFIKSKSSNFSFCEVLKSHIDGIDVFETYLWLVDLGYPDKISKHLFEDEVIACYCSEIDTHFSGSYKELMNAFSF